VFWVCAAVALVGLAALAAVLIPQISESKREDERRARAEAAQALTERKRALRLEQRPRYGGLLVPGEIPLVRGVERAITADVSRRVRAGALPNPAKRTECERLGRDRGRIAYSCTAVTSDLPGGEVSRAGFVGYAYRALADPATGRFAYCKFSGEAGEGALIGKPLVPLPKPCGG
jgi:hypothetical protein